MKRKLSASTRLVLLGQFETAYEDLVDQLCASAQFGVNGKAELTYQRLRGVYLREFRFVQPTLGAFEEAPGELQKIASEPTLSKALLSDDGTLIPTIMRARETLDRCANYLRVLEKAA